MRLTLKACIFLAYILISRSFAHTVISFEQALAQAYQNNPELQVQIEKAKVAKGAYIQSSRFLNPSLMLEGENIGGSGSYKGTESAETTLSIIQPIPLGGKWHFQKTAANANYVAMIAAISAKQSEIYTAVGRAYIDALYAEKWYQVTQKLTALNSDIVADIIRRKKYGASAELDLKLAQIALKEAEIEQSRARQGIKKRHALLARRMGYFSTKNFSLNDKGLPHRLIKWQAIKKQSANSAFLFEIQQKLHAQRAQINATKKKVWPTLSLQLGARHFSDDNENALVISAASSVPVFDQNQGNIYTAEANYTRIMKELQAKKLKIKQQLYNYFLDMVQQESELKQVESFLLPTAQKAAQHAQLGYKKGLYSYFELSIAMRRLFEEERHYQDSHAKLDKAKINILGLLRSGIK